MNLSWFCGERPSGGLSLDLRKLAFVKGDDLAVDSSQDVPARLRHSASHHPATIFERVLNEQLNGSNDREAELWSLGLAVFHAERISEFSAGLYAVKLVSSWKAALFSSRVRALIAPPSRATLDVPARIVRLCPFAQRLPEL